MIPDAVPGQTRRRPGRGRGVPYMESAFRPGPGRSLAKPTWPGPGRLRPPRLRRAARSGVQRVRPVGVDLVKLQRARCVLCGHRAVLCQGVDRGMGDVEAVDLEVP